MGKRQEIPTSLRHKSGSFDERVSNLVKDMLESIRLNRPYNLSLPAHHETTEALHKLVYLDGGERTLLVSYSDGTVGRNFPVGSLWKPSQGWIWMPNENRHFHIGTLSFRHVDYDKFVDFYLLRDKETRGLSQAQIEQEAYNRMKVVLDSNQLVPETFITIYQAGLEPLAVGVYRALVEHLVLRNKGKYGTIRVRPIYKANSLGEDGSQDPLSVWGTGL